MSDKHHDSHQAGTEAYAALRTKALESLLVEKGLITTDVIDTVPGLIRHTNSASWRTARRQLPNSASGGVRE